MISVFRVDVAHLALFNLTLCKTHKYYDLNDIIMPWISENEQGLRINNLLDVSETLFKEGGYGLLLNLYLVFASFTFCVTMETKYYFCQGCWGNFYFYQVPRDLLHVWSQACESVLIFFLIHSGSPQWGTAD